MGWSEVFEEVCVSLSGIVHWSAIEGCQFAGVGTAVGVLPLGGM